MKIRSTAISVVVLLLSLLAFSQDQPATLKISAALVDKELNVKPVPKLKIVLTNLQDKTTVETTTGFDGKAEVVLPAGTYSLTTPDPVEFQGHRFAWKVDTLDAGVTKALELSNDNATKTVAPIESSGRVTDDFAGAFKKYQSSVATVWGEFGRGTGFFFDNAGLVLTNYHVVGPSEYIAVQFDDDHKLPAIMLASDPLKDMAILWVDIGKFSGATVAPLFQPKQGDQPVIEGEKVFTIGSPLNQRKILTTGIVSKVEAHAIISDININHGNSGGPLFNSLGAVVGLTTFAEGRGVAGIIRIEDATDLIAKARLAMGDHHPIGQFLPTEPTTPFPIEAIKATLLQEKFDSKPYFFGMGDYDIAVITPPLKYWHEAEGGVKAAKAKQKRNQKSAQAAQGTFNPLDDFKNWAAYVGEYTPTISIRATPHLRETFMSALGRGMAAYGGVYGMPATLKFKADFYKMALMCGDKEVEPINRGKIAHSYNERGLVNVTDSAFEGYYEYRPEAFSPNCGTMTLKIFSEKNPESAKVKTLDMKTTTRVWSDFDAWRKVAPPAGN